ncbi:hypothetical protein PUN28_016898 [Cardiocondyla obscurior]|uniref:Uncharacterized protein n=1 Tax=Cardiocondyla obscurior TaxID=286306 RepID=A0AAW2EPA9_9HYME
MIYFLKTRRAIVLAKPRRLNCVPIGYAAILYHELIQKFQTHGSLRIRFALSISHTTLLDPSIRLDQISWLFPIRFFFL